MLKTCGVIGAVLLLAACGAPKPREVPARAAPEAAAPAEPPPGAGIYRIDAAQSELRLLVYRAGAMARFGHNHVIVNRAVGGWVKFTGDASKASFSLSVPVADFVIDEAQTRGEEGSDFSEEVADDARSGTRHNMLSAGLLNGEDFPSITLTSVAVSPTVAPAGGYAIGTAAAGAQAAGPQAVGAQTVGAQAVGAQAPGAQAPGAQATGAQAAGLPAAVTFTVTMVVRVAGHASTLVVPFMLETSSGRVSASGSVALRQTALGLVPFSVMLGALQVQDELTVKFRLVAVS